ncbi:MAG: hypothetical protein IJT94_16590, partial [Oscillibacter sp.]|nr:hypothetical protein [Oscillibacter sp.]
ENYRITSRGASGVRNYNVTEKTGKVVGVKVVDGSEDLILVTQSGILLRTPVASIRSVGRSSVGVIVMRFKEAGDQVISVALTRHEEPEPLPELLPDSRTDLTNQAPRPLAEPKDGAVSELIPVEPAEPEVGADGEADMPIESAPSQEASGTETD